MLINVFLMFCEMYYHQLRICFALFDFFYGNPKVCLEFRFYEITLQTKVVKLRQILYGRDSFEISLTRSRALTLMCSMNTASYLELKYSPQSKIDWTYVLAYLLKTESFNLLLKFSTLLNRTLLFSAWSNIFDGFIERLCVKCDIVV